METRSSNLIVIFILFINFTGCFNRTLLNFEKSIVDYIDVNKYQSTAVCVMVDGKLVYMRGFTLDESSTLQGNALKIWPIGKISESITAIAVMKMAQDGDLRLNSTVFGPRGILRDLKPFRTDRVTDDRLYDITVEDLLRHTSGWDSAFGPLLDPTLNEKYLKLGVKVPDIKKELGLLGPLNTDGIISYMMTQPLQYQPGSKAVHSYFHSSVLGRVIEEASGQEYAKYVKKYVLELCGMWNTHLGASHHSSLSGSDPTAASVGWYSNVVDILRLMKCIDGTGRYRLLPERLLRRIIERGEELSEIDRWHGLGFLTNEHGAIWQSMFDSRHNSLVFHNSLVNPARSDPGSDRHEKLSFAFFFESSRPSPGVNKHKLAEIVRSVYEWPSSTNLFTTDLTDIPPLVDGSLAKLNIPERQMKAFANALKSERYRVEWVSAVDDRRDTFFSVIAKPFASVDENFILETGLTRKTLEDHKLLLDSYRYDLQFLQSYISHSHDPRYRYLAISYKEPKISDSIVGTKSDNEQYKAFFVDKLKAGYLPAIQSITYIHGKLTNDFIMVKKTNSDNKSYINMHLTDMHDIVQLNAAAKRFLKYLDVTDEHGTPTFSAIFAKNPRILGGVFRKDMTDADLLRFIEDNRENDMVPVVIVGYVTENKIIKYIAYVAHFKP